MFWRWVSFFLVCASAQVGAEEPWVADEVFRQIAELRKSVNELRAELAELKSAKIKGTESQASIAIEASSGNTLGKNSAPLAIVEFMDYECPFCRKHFSDVFPELKNKYIESGKVKYIVKDYPLSFHEQAIGAALAVRCAGSQGKYWEMRKRLFAGSERLSGSLYASAAKELGLDETIFKACIDNRETKNAIEEDSKLGTALGIKGTPSFFVGRIEGGVLKDFEKLEGAQSLNAFSGILNRFSEVKHK